MTVALTGEVVVTHADIKESIASAKSSLEDAAKEIVWQIENRAWEVLGYADWDEMRQAEYGGAAFMVPRAERPELVARMRAQGLTQQEIADTAGISQTQVQRDLNTQMGNERPAAPITNSRGQQRPATYAPRQPQAPERTVAEDVEEFPDLAYYAETGRAADVPGMASDLRRFRERGDLDERLSTLRRSIEIDRSKRDGTYVPTPASSPARHCPTCTC